jgi:CheY-like chemotaxis protein
MDKPGPIIKWPEASSLTRFVPYSPDQASMRRNPPGLNSKRASAVKTILVLHAYVPIRTVVVQLLRDCGYRALEMASTDEAIVALKGTAIPVDAIIGEIDIPGIMNGFEFAQWARSVRPDAKILLAGTPERMVRNAADLSEVGPTRKRTYEQALVLERLKRIVAARAKQQSGS